MTRMQLCYFRNTEVLQEYWNSKCKTDTSRHKTVVAEPEGSTTQVRKFIIDRVSSQFLPLPIIAPTLCITLSSFYPFHSPTDTSSVPCFQGRWQHCEKRVLPSSCLSVCPHKKNSATAKGIITKFYI